LHIEQQDIAMGIGERRFKFRRVLDFGDYLDVALQLQ